MAGASNVDLATSRPNLSLRDRRNWAQWLQQLGTDVVFKENDLPDGG